MIRMVADQKIDGTWTQETWWINFLDYVDYNLFEHKRDQFGNLGIIEYEKNVDAALQTWNARCEISDDNECIIFENERDASVFLLRWS